MEEKAVAPPLLILGHHMDVLGEEKQFICPVIPTAVGGQHIVLMPGIRPETECSEILVGFIFETSGLHKDGIREHVHVIVEGKSLYLGIICSGPALDYLSVLVPHRAAIHKDSHGILRIIIKMAGTQGVVVLVGKLDNRSPELSKILIHQIRKFLTGQNGLVLKYAHIAPRLDDPGLHVPQCSVTQQVRVVVKESGRTFHFSETCTFHIYHLSRLGTHQYNKTVRLLIFLSKDGQN